jgi:hypothetical protein
MKPIDYRTRRPVKLDVRVEPADPAWAVFDLEIVHRAFRESLLMARLGARPSKYVPGRTRR